MPRNPRHNYCLNCEVQLPSEYNGSQELFCSNCGQSTKDSKLSFLKLVKDGISNIFDLDSRLVHTLRDLYSPSKITKAYIAGKRKYYVNPVRLFIFTLLACVAVFLYIMNHGGADFDIETLEARSTKSKLLTRYNQLSDTLDHQAVTDTIRSRLFRSVKPIDQDTFGSDGALNIRNSAEILRSYGISTYDAVNLPIDEIYDEYNVVGFKDQMIVGQYIRIYSNPEGTIFFCIKNVIWAIIITLLLIGFFMKLIYIRSQYYLVEHMVLALNYHSLINALVLILAIIMVITVKISGSSNMSNMQNISKVFYGLLIIIQFITLKSYYKQGFFKTVLKMLLINISYLFIFLFSSIIVSLISIVLY